MKRLPVPFLSLLMLLAGAACTSEADLRQKTDRALAARLAGPPLVSAVQIPAPDTLADCYALARKNSPALKDSDIAVAEQALAVEQARRVVVPRFSVRATASPHVRGHDGYDDNSAGVYLSFDFAKALVYNQQTRYCIAQIALVEEERRQVELMLANRLLALIARVVLLRQEHTAAGTEIALQTEYVSAAGRLSTAGLPGPDTMTSRTSLSDAEERASALEREIRGAEQQLAAEFGIGAIGTTLAAEFGDWLLAQQKTPAPDATAVDALVGLAWTMRPDVRIAGLRSLMADDAVTLAKWSFIQNADLSFGTGHIANPRNDGYLRYLPIFRLELPLFDAGDFRRRVKQARLQQSRAMLSIERTARTVSADVSARVEDLRYRKKNLERSQGDLAAAAKSAPMPNDGGFRQLEKKILQARAEFRDCAARLAWLEAWLGYRTCLGQNPFELTETARTALH